VADLAVLIYFIHHIATQIQLPEVIAGISADLSAAIDDQVGDGPPGPVTLGPPACWPACRARVAVVEAADSGYLPVRSPAHAAGHRTAGRRGHLSEIPAWSLPGQGQPAATVWPASAAGKVADGLTPGSRTGPYRTLAQDVSFGIDQLVEIGDPGASTAVNDTFTV